MTTYYTYDATAKTLAAAPRVIVRDGATIVLGAPEDFARYLGAYPRAAYVPPKPQDGKITLPDGYELINGEWRNVWRYEDAPLPSIAEYDAAMEAGYQGTEPTFNAALAALPYHNARHLPGGADPITVKTGNLENGAVTADKLAAGAVSAVYTAELPVSGWTGSEAPYSQTVAVGGLKASDTPIADLVLSGSYAVDRVRLEQYGLLYRADTGTDSLTVYAAERPTELLPIRLLCIRK